MFDLFQVHSHLLFMCLGSLRADVSYFHCFTEAKEIGDVCTQASVWGARIAWSEQIEVDFSLPLLVTPRALIC